MQSTSKLLQLTRKTTRQVLSEATGADSAEIESRRRGKYIKRFRVGKHSVGAWVERLSDEQGLHKFLVLVGHSTHVKSLDCS